MQNLPKLPFVISAHSEGDFGELLTCIHGLHACKVLRSANREGDAMTLIFLQEFWKYDPFAAHKEENGDIYGRGTQVW